MMSMTRRMALLTAAAALTGVVVACSGSTAMAPQQGTVKLQLTDAPFSTDSVLSANVYVVRVDARVAAADSAAADSVTADTGSTTDTSTTKDTSTTNDSTLANGWMTLATPDTLVDLLAYQNGNTLPLGAATVATGNYGGFRMVIDPTRSFLVLANGDTLSGATTPGIKFPSGDRSGIKINLTSPVAVTANDTTSMLLDFQVGNSFVMRGNSISQNGLLFKPVIQATIQ